MLVLLIWGPPAALSSRSGLEPDPGLLLLLLIELPSIIAPYLGTEEDLTALAYLDLGSTRSIVLSLPTPAAAAEIYGPAGLLCAVYS